MHTAPARRGRRPSRLTGTVGTGRGSGGRRVVVPACKTCSHAHCGSGRRHRWCPVPARSEAGRAGRGHHGHRQHRGRHPPLRAEGLPGPRHGDVHARRRHQRGAGLGAGRRDLPPQGGARGVRRRARVVRARRPGLRHAHRADADDRRRVSAERGHRGAVRPVEAGRAAHPDDRRPRRDPCRRRGGRRAQGRSTSRSTGCGCGPPCRPRRSCRSAPSRRSRRPGSWRRSPRRTSILFPPSNPVVSVGTILAVPGIREAIAEAGVPVVGLSPIVGDAPVRGMADKVLAAVGVESTAAAVAEHYGSGLLDGWLVDTVDAGVVERVEAAGIRCRAVPLMMTDLDATARMAREALALAEEVRGRERGVESRPRVASGGDRAVDRRGLARAAGYRVWALAGLPEVRAGDDLAKLIAAAEPGLADGDVLLVTSKIVSKAEGRIVEAADREAAIDAETVRVVARRGALRIVENRQGLVMAAAGVDASNTPSGTVLLLPEDPDASARAIRDGLRDALGVDVGVVVTDTFGRPWRSGADGRRHRRRRRARARRSAGRHGRVRQSAQRDRRRHRRRTGRRRRPGEGQGRRAARRRRARAAACRGRGRRRGDAGHGARRARRHVPARHLRGRTAGGDPAAYGPGVHRRAGRPRGGTAGRGRRRDRAGAAPHDAVAVRAAGVRGVADRGCSTPCGTRGSRTCGGTGRARSPSPSGCGAGTCCATRRIWWCPVW